MTALSIDDVAATSDDQAVRSRFDARNVVWLTVLLFSFLILAMIELGGALARRTLFDLAIAPPNLLFVLVLLLVMRDLRRFEQRGARPGLWGLTKWVRRHVSATVIVCLVVQYV